MKNLFHTTSSLETLTLSLCEDQLVCELRDR